MVLNILILIWMYFSHLMIIGQGQGISAAAWLEIFKLHVSTLDNKKNLFLFF